MLRDLVVLMRPKHYLKNTLIFVPLVFSGKLFQEGLFVHTLVAAAIFSFITSVVYIINDIRDAKRDRIHPKKKFRPIASGKVSNTAASIFAALLIAVSVALALVIDLRPEGWFLITAYLTINIAYSAGLKNIPIVDIGILAASFIIRVVYGAEVIDVEVSRWLYLTVLAGAFYLSLGKRRNEIIAVGTDSRKVNKLYSLNFLDKNMYVCLSLTLVFYSLWATDPTGHNSLFWTIPLVILILMDYSLNVEKDGSLGDPVDVVTSDRILAVLALVFIILTTYLVYS